jgi:tripartite-type tricarboxylate transporter receptor subunit TctC
MLSDTVQLCVLPVIPTVTQNVAAGRLRVLAVAADERSPLTPDLPSAAEAGFPVGSSLDSYFGMYVPAKTPDSVVKRLSDALKEALNTPAVIEKLKSIQVVPTFIPPRDFAADLKARDEAIGQIIRDLGIQPQ